MKALELATVIESLAKGLSAMHISVPEVEQSASELRRLAEVNAELLAFAEWFVENRDGKGVAMATAAIAKAKEQQ